MVRFLTVREKNNIKLIDPRVMSTRATGGGGGQRERGEKGRLVGARSRREESAKEGRRRAVAGERI